MLNPLDQSFLIDNCEKDFYSFCRVLKTRFYLPNRTHLYTLCHTLQDFAENKIIGKDGTPIQKLMINVPPRHGKTLTVDMFSQWLLGHDPKTSIIRACYNETLSGRSAKTVRDGIQEIKASGERIVYGDIFPNTKIKYGDASYQMWSLEGSPFSFLATSPTGTMTGVGCKWGIIDDVIRDAKEAFNDRILDEHMDWYDNTYSSRLEAGAKELVVMTRWCPNDLCGKLLAREQDAWYVIKMPAREGGTMLCDDILDSKTYDSRKLHADPMIFSANYDQETFESKDRLYGEFKTYDTVQEKYDRIEAYFDTADEGGDYLAGIVVGVKDGIGDVLDLIYTQDSMEKTEPQSAIMLTKNKVNKAVVESNNGGRGFARNIEKIMRDSGNTFTQVEWFHQGENKMARILSNATSVTNCLRFPSGWQEVFPQVYRELVLASRTRKMVHDDIEDCLTGVIEKILGNNTKFEVW
jgi:predicted phage terminase large subunit-like protein